MKKKVDKMLLGIFQEGEKTCISYDGDFAALIDVFTHIINEVLRDERNPRLEMIANAILIAAARCDSASNGDIVEIIKGLQDEKKVMEGLEESYVN